MNGQDICVVKLGYIVGNSWTCMTLRSVASASTYTGCLSVEHYLIDLDVKIDEDGARAACQQSIYDMNIDVDGAQAVSIVYLSIYLSIQLERGGGAREKEREREREREM